MTELEKMIAEFDKQNGTVKTQLSTDNSTPETTDLASMIAEFDRQNANLSDDRQEEIPTESPKTNEWGEPVYSFERPVEVEGAKLNDFLTPKIFEQKPNAKSETELPKATKEEKPYNPEGLLPIAESGKTEMPQSFTSPKVFEEFTPEEKLMFDVDKATDNAFNAAQEEATKQMVIARKERGTFGVMDEFGEGVAEKIAYRQSAGADAVIKRTFESISADDINTIIEERVANNEEFKAKKQAFDDEVKRIMPNSNDNFSDAEIEALFANMTPEEREAAEKQIAETTQALEALQTRFATDVEGIYKSESKDVEVQINNRIINRLAKLNLPQNDLEYIGKAIYNNSLVGTLYEIGVNAAAGGSGTDYIVSQQALAQAKPSAIAKVVGGAGAILADGAIFGALGAGGSLAGVGMRELATQVVAGQIARKAAVSATNSAVKTAARRIVEKSVLQQFASSAIAQSLTLGGYNGLLTAAQETLSPTGENGSYNWRNILTRFGEGLLTGVALGGVSVGTSAAKGAMYRARPDMAYTATGMAADLGIGLAGFTAENAAFLGIGSIVSGEEITAEAIGESFATLGLLKGIGALKRVAKGEKLMQQPDFVERTISDLKFTKEEMDAMRKAGVDMEAMDFISLAVTEMNNVPYTESRRSVINAYNTVMASREIPTSAKVKLKYIVTGEVPRVVGPSRAEVVEGENGIEVRTYDYQDRVVQIRPFETTESATKFVSRIQPLLERNTIVDGAKTLRGADSLIAVDRAIDEYMQTGEYFAEREKAYGGENTGSKLPAKTPLGKEALMREMRIYLGIEPGTLPEGSESRIARIVAIAKNVYQDSVSALQKQVAEQHGATVSELLHAINVKPDLRTVRESQLVKAYVDGLKQFSESMSGPVEAEQARYAEQIRPQIEQGKREVEDAERETAFVRESLNEAAKRMATEDGKQIAIVRLATGEQVAVYKGRIVTKENGTIDTEASENTIVIKRIDAEGNEVRNQIGIGEIAEVVEFSTPEAAVEESMSVVEAQAAKKLSLDNAIAERGEQGVEVVTIDGNSGKIVGIDENGAYILRAKVESGKEVDVPVSINDIAEINTEQPVPATTEQIAVADATERVVEAGLATDVEVEYDDDFPPLTEEDMAPAINPDNIQWDKLSQEEYADVSAMVMGDATTLADSHIYYTNSRGKLQAAQRKVAEQQKVIDKLNSRFATLSSPAEAQKLRKQVATAEQEKAKREQAVKNIEQQMAKYAYAMKKYGVEVATENDLLAERTRLEEERNALLEADKELDRYEQEEATKGKKTIANTEANRKYIEQLYADRLGVSPAQAGPRQAILWDLANGAIKLRWDNATTDSGAVQRSLQAELGVRGTEERRAYKAVIDNKNGQSVDAYVHDLWQNGEWGQEISTEELKDELLGVLQSTPNGSLALKELADMSGVQADLEAQISLGKNDIQRKLEEVDASLAKNAQQMADFRKRINDAVQKLESVAFPIEEGEYGYEFTGLQHQAQEAIDLLISRKEGRAIAALHHKDIGDIDLIWGYEGKEHRADGYGLARVLKLQPQLLNKIQSLLNNMEIVAKYDDTIQLEDKRYTAIVERAEIEPKNWVLTDIHSRFPTFSEQRIADIIRAMQAGAEVAREIELTPENWRAEFGEDGVVKTPIGEVKMGDNQYVKLLERKRANYFGMIKPTLSNPDIVLEEYDPVPNAERDSKCLFVKTFAKNDGSRYVHFESVTVKKDNKEVSISSHEITPDGLQKKMHNDNVVHLRDSFLDSEWRLTEPSELKGSDLVPTPNSSESKDTTTIPENQISEEEILGNAPISEDIPKVLSLEQYLGELGLSSPMSDYMIDKTRQPHLRTQSQKNKFEKDAKEAMLTYAQQREQAIVDYKKLVEEGRITPPSNIDRLIASAHGHNDLESTQAARRQLAKRGIDWESGLPKEAPFMIEQKPVEQPEETADQAFVRERMEILADVTGVKPHILNEKEFGEKLAEIQSEIEAVRMSLLPKSTAPETALPEEDTSFKGTAISSADGAKILKNIDKTIDDYENKSNNTRNFIGDIAKALDIERIDRKSKYKTIEAKNGKVVSIRISDHNATVKNFDNRKENYGLSIVISRKDNEGISNNGNAHLVEYFYSDAKLKRADGKPLVEILKSLKQALYSGEYKDTTGLAKREEVNNPRFAIEAYHGSGADFEKFDHSFMSTGEGAQAYGYGTYVTTRKGIAENYAETIGGNKQQERRYEAEQNLLRIRKKIADNNQDIEKRKREIQQMQNTYAELKEYISHFNEEEVGGKTRYVLDSSYIAADEAWPLELPIPKPDSEGSYLTYEESRSELQKLQEEIDSTQALIDSSKARVEKLKPLEEAAEKEWQAVTVSGKIDELTSRMKMHQDTLLAHQTSLAASEKRLEIKTAERDWYNEELSKLEKEYGKNSPEYKNFVFNNDYIEEEYQSVVKSVESNKRLVAYSEEQLRIEENTMAELKKIQPATFRNLYTVEVSDNTGDNYLSWDKEVPATMIERINNYIKENYGWKAHSEADLKQGMTGEQVYKNLTRAWGKQAGASLLLSDIGFTGIEYPAQYTTGGRADGAKNYVIFNADDVKIVEHVRYMKTPQGVIYGFTFNGETYIDGSELRPGVLIHEFTELWCEIVAEANPELWDEGKKLLRETDTYKEVMADPNYKNASEEAQYSETLSRITTAKAEKKMGTISDNKSLISKIRSWLRKFWGEVKSAFSKWSKKELKDLTIDQFSSMPLMDYFNGVDIRKYRKAKVKSHKQAQLDIIKKHNPMQDDVHTGIRKVEDIKSFDEVLGESRKNQAEYGELTYPDMNIDMMESAAESGMITVYSSYPIKQGVFVTPSYMNAQDYAGGSGRVYQATVPVDDVAWIAEDEGQYARVETEPMRPMIIGEKGAAALDQAEEATTRLDNLAVAREMEKANRDAKAIKLATSWERGADGKWRYEIDDRPVREEAVNRLTNQLEYQQNSSIMLYDLLSDADELFTAYPDLMKLRVVVEGKSDSVIPAGRLEWADDIYDAQIVLNRAAVQSHFAQDELEGYGRADRALIKIRQGINPKTQEKFSSEAEQAEYLDLYTGIAEEYLAKYKKSKAMRLATTARVVAHEVQHSIQFIEGFARGSSVEEFDDKRGTLISNIDFATDGDFLKGSSISNAQSVHEALNKKVPYTEMTVKEAYADKLQRVASKYGYENIEALADDFTKFPSAFEQYHRTAGEVESRNVQKRILEGLTPEERRATLLSETEDVAREDQIFLENNLGVAQSVEVSEPVEAPTRKPRKSAAEKSLDKIDSLREQLKNKKRSLNDTLLDVYNFLTSKDIAETMGEGVGKAQYRRVIKNSIEAIRKAYDVTDAEEKRKTIFKYLGEIDDSLSQLLTRQRLNEVTDILDKAIYGYTAQGVRTGKRIDEHTREIFDILRNAIGEPVEEERDDSGRRKPVRYRLKNRTEAGDITSSFRLRSVGSNEGVIAKLRSEADDIIASADELDTATTRAAAQLEYASNLLSLYDNALQLNEAIGQTTDEIADIQREIERTNEQYRAAATGSDEKKNLYKMRQKLQNDLEAEQMNRAALRHRYASMLKTFTTSLEELDEKGAGDFARAEMAKAEQAVQWCRGIYKYIKNPNAPVLPREDYDRQGKEIKVNWKGLNTRAKINESAFMATFAEMSRDIDINSIPGQWAKDGWYYQFMLSEGGYMARTDWRYKQEVALREELDAEVLKLSGDKKADEPYKLFAQLAQEPSGLVIPRLSVGKNKEGKTVGGYQDNIPLSIGQILYMRNAIRQPNGYAGYLAWGIPEEDMKRIAQYAEANYPKYCRFFDWVVSEFMPKLYEMQDAIYFEKFGTHLPKTAFYFPFVRDKRFVGKIAEVGEGEVSLPSSVTGNIVERVKTSAKMDLQADAFSVLQDHIKETLDWCAYSELTDKFNRLVTSHAFGNMLKAQGVSVQKLRESYEVAVGQGKINSTDNTTLTKTLNAISKGLVAGNIVLNPNAAIKQIVSATAVLGYSANPKLLAIWAKNFFVPSVVKTGIGKVVQQMKRGEIDPVEAIDWKVVGDNWKWAIENIPTLRERWEGREAGFEVLKSHSFDSWDKLTAMITNAGLAPNAFVDMLTCSNAAKTVYEYEYPRLLERGRSKEEAHREACVKAAIFVNETQQSSLNGFLSSFQSGGGLQRILGVGLGAYQNSSMAFARNERFALTNMLRMANFSTRNDMQMRQVEAYKELGIEEQKATELAKQDISESYGQQIAGFVHNGVLNNYIWKIAGVLLGGLASAGFAAMFDKEEWNKLWKNEKFRQELASAVSAETLVWQTPLFYNAPITKQIVEYSHNVAEGKAYGGIFESPTSQSAQDLIDAIFEQWIGVKKESTGERERKEPTRYDRSAEWLVASTLIKAGLGVNPDLVVRMAQGIDDMMKDGVQVEDVMATLASPRGLTRAIAGEPRSGETKEEYLDRMSYIYRQVNAGSGEYNKKFVSERTKEYIDNKDNKLYRELGIVPREVRMLEQKAKAIRKQLQFFDKSDEGIAEFKALPETERKQQIEIAKRYDKVFNLTRKMNEGILPFDEEGMRKRKDELQQRYEMLKQVYDMWIEYNNK